MSKRAGLQRPRAAATITSPRNARTRKQTEAAGYVSSDIQFNNILDMSTSEIEAAFASMEKGAPLPTSPLSSPRPKPAGRRPIMRLSGSEEGEVDEQVDEHGEEDYDDDNAAHSHASRAKSAATTPKVRVAWGKDGARQLVLAINEWVTEHAGRLPPVLRTGKDSKVNEAWRTIARKLDVCSGIDVEKAARASSLKWSTVRAELKVSRYAGRRECSSNPLINAACLLRPTEASRRGVSGAARRDR